jgi:hypothetical protein
MKYIVNQNKFKDFLKNKFNFDLTGKIEMITNRYQVPFSFDRIIPGDVINRRLNSFGPMYLITMGEDMVYLFQQNNNDDHLLIDKHGWFTDREFMEMWGIGKLGLSMNALIDIYFEEEE